MRVMAKICAVSLMTLSLLVATRWGVFLSSKPDVKTISTQELIKLQQEQEEAEVSAAKQGLPKPEASFILVDVRSEAESQVSIIPGAILQSEFENHLVQHQGKTVIPYCTVGVRSFHYAQELAGKKIRVLNYQGSILEWCQEKQPLITHEGQPTNRVHVYSSDYKVPSEYQPIW